MTKTMEQGIRENVLVFKNQDRFDIQWIEITRAEGPHNLCGITKVFNTYNDVNQWLLEQSETFPKEGGYDKHDFTVIFDNGSKYSGRLDCQHPCSLSDDKDLDIRRHIKESLEWLAGRTYKPHCGTEQYNQILKTYKKAGYTEQAIDFLDNYNI